MAEDAPNGAGGTSALHELLVNALRWEDTDLEAARPTLLVRRTLTRGEDGRGWVGGASAKSGTGGGFDLHAGQ